MRLIFDNFASELPNTTKIVSQPSLVILAAGMGSRYGGLKQVDGVGPQEEAIIEYSIYDAIRAGFGKVVFVIRKDIEAPFKEKFGGIFEGRIALEYVYQERDSYVPADVDPSMREKPWGTAHAMLVAESVVREPFAVINADDYYGVDAFRTMAQFLEQDCTPEVFSMIGYVLRNTLSDHGAVNRGVAAVDEANMLTQIDERLKIERQADGEPAYLGEDGLRYPLSEESYVSMNFWGFHPSIFTTSMEMFTDFAHRNQDAPKAEFLIPEVVDTLIKRGEAQVKVLGCEDRWYGVTYREDKPAVEAAFAELVAKGVYPNPLWG